MSPTPRSAKYPATHSCHRLPGWRKCPPFVIISAGGGAQEAVELKTVSPQYLGAVVVCDGADSPQVQLAVTQAVAQFTGLSTDHISVLRKQPDSQSK